MYGFRLRQVINDSGERNNGIRAQIRFDVLGTDF
jgi:hypothetical protein